MSLNTVIIALAQDYRYGTRALRKDPGFAALVVLILALGIGATTTIFSVVKGVLLDPLPFAHADALVRVWESSTSRNVLQSAVSVPAFEDWRRDQQSFESLAATEMATFNLTGARDPERVPAARITTNLLSTLGVSPAAGRGFRPDEERPGAAPVALLGYSLWQRRFGGDPSVLTRAVQLNGETFTVVGVMPADFDFPSGRELWVPLVIDPAREPWRADRANRNLAVFGRLVPGVSFAAAAADLERLAATVATSHPATNGGWSARLQTFREWLVPAPVRQATLVLFGAVGLLLLLTCANVANLLLARTVARQREFATHAALGASRARLIRQLLTESTLLAVCGGAAGALLARWAVSAISAVTIPDFPRLQHIAVDTIVLAFALAVSVCTGLVFGLLPAWWTSQPSLLAGLKEGGTSGSSARTQRMRGGLVAVQIALTVSVVATGALLGRSFIELQRVPLGFRSSDVLTFQVNLPGSGYASPERRVDFFARWFERLRSIPGIVEVGASTHAPYAPSEWKVDVTVLGAPPPTADAHQAAVARAVTPGYFHAMGIPVKRGRVFSERQGPPDVLELIVTERFVRRFFPSTDPIGKQFQPGSNNPLGVVIGVVGDVRTAGGSEPEPAFYFDYAYLGMPSLVVAVHTNGQPEHFVSGIRHELRALDSAQPIFNVRTVEQLVSRATAQPRFSALLVGLVAAAAIGLAAFGTYSMITYVVRQRRKEIAIRLALGASHAHILWGLIGESMRYTLPGVAVGVAVALAIGHMLRTLLFRISPTDVVTFTATPLAILFVAWLATYIPARRAARSRLVAALRND